MNSTLMVERGAGKLLIAVAQRLGVFALMGALFFTPIVKVYDAQMDYRAHARTAHQWMEEGRPQASHFLFHALSIAVVRLIPSLDFGDAGIMVGVTSWALLGLLVFEVVKRYAFRSSAPAPAFVISTVIAFSLIIIAPVTIFTVSSFNLVHGYLSPTSYHNPTITLLRPLALLLFIILVRTISFGGERASAYLSLTTLSVAATLAKPSYTICILPALVLLAGLRQLAGQPNHLRMLGIAFILPASAVLAWQFSYTFAGQNASHLVFAPLAVMAEKSSFLAVKYLLSIAFPACVYLLFFSSASRRVDLNLAWLAFAIATAYSYLLAESGKQASHGNWVWSAQITLFVLFVSSVVFLLRQAKLESEDSAGGISGKTLVCTVVYSLHLTSGLLFYWINTTPVSMMWWGGLKFSAP